MIRGTSLQPVPVTSNWIMKFIIHHNIKIHVIEFQETEQKIQVLDHLKHPGMIDKLIPNP